MFWAHKDRLLAASRGDLPVLVASLGTPPIRSPGESRWRAFPTPVERVAGHVLLASVSDMPDMLEGCLPHDIATQQGEIAYLLVTRSSKRFRRQDSVHPSPDLWHIHHVLDDKKGQLTFRQSVLPQSLAYIHGRLSEEPRRRVCVACDTGQDVSVGIALATLVQFFDDDGHLCLDGRPGTLGIYHFWRPQYKPATDAHDHWQRTNAQPKRNYSGLFPVGPRQTRLGAPSNASTNTSSRRPYFALVRALFYLRVMVVVDVLLWTTIRNEACTLGLYVEGTSKYFPAPRAICAIATPDMASE
jgi:hypothetical protein